jgi:hypothetical protein
LKRWLGAGLLACAALALLPSIANAQATVYVGYADNSTSSPLFFPAPWSGAPGTIFLGDAGPNYDAGAIMIKNTGTASIKIGQGCYVDGFTNHAIMQLWDEAIGSGVTIKPGQSLILTETHPNNFRTADMPMNGQPGKPLTATATIHLTMNGKLTSFQDTAHVLTGGGYDSYFALGRNKSLGWRPIGTSGPELPAGVALSPIDVQTYHYDMARTGLNPAETLLNQANVGSASFGMYLKYPVDGQVYSEPLIQHVTIGNTPRTLMIVCTEHNSVYAFDADNTDPGQTAPIWHVNFGASVPNWMTGSGDITPEIGITSTPVIDPTGLHLYLLAKTLEQGQAVQRIHNMDTRTGAEWPGSPMVIQTSMKGTGEGSNNGVLPYYPLQQHNRCALLLLNKVVYVASASHGDNDPYHGWLLAFDSNTLKLLRSFCTSPDYGKAGDNVGLQRAGIWQGGGGLVSDGTYIYFATGNGIFDVNAGGRDYGDSVIKLNPNNMTVADYFTPYNQNALNDADADLGSGGPILVPDSAGSTAHPHLLVHNGKEGRLYLLDRSNLGKYNPTADSQIVQSIPGATGGVWGVPAYFNGSIYYGGGWDNLKAFSVSSAQLSTSPTSASADWYNFPGTTPSVSANGVKNGIVWAIQNNGNAVLNAYDAGNLGHTLYSSSQVPSRDGLDIAVKFTTPVVANGKVYINQADAVSVFGNGYWTTAPTINPGTGEFSGPTNVTISDTDSKAVIYYTTDGSYPTTASKVYSGAINISANTVVTAIAMSPGFRASGAVSAQFVIDSVLGTGTGLTGQYFTNMTLTPPAAVTEVDPTINWNWNGASPVTGIPQTQWSAVWTGTVQPRTTGAYTFSTWSDDGVQLWVNGQQLINNWTDHGPTLDSGTIQLTAGQKYSIKLQYYQDGGGSELILMWSPLGLPAYVIPQTQLYPTQ